MEDESPIWPLTRDEILKQVFGYQKLLTAYGFTLLNDWQAAEDIVQETLLFIAGNHEKYDGERPLLPWARGIVRFKCLNGLRSRKRAPLTGDAELLAQLLDENLTDLWDEKAATEMAKRIQALRNCMAELPARACRLMSDFYVNRKPGKDLAEREKMNASNLRSHLSRIRKRLRDCVSERLSEAAAAEKEGYWRILDDYYGQEPGAAGAGIRDAVSAILSEENGAGELLDFFIEVSAFGICLQEMRPLAGGIPRRPRRSEKTFVFPEPNEASEAGSFEIVSDDEARDSPAEAGERKVPGIFAAAAIVTLLAVIGWGLWDRDGVAESVVTAVRGEVICDNPEDGRRVLLEKGDRIPPGSKVMVGDGGIIDLAFEGGKGAEVKAFANTVMILGERANPTLNIITIFQGSFQADVEKQGRGNPLTILTPDARSTVLGTEFLASPQELEVDEGLVRMERLSDGKIVNVPASHRVSVEDMKVRKVPAPDLTRGLAGWWAFDGEGAEVARDSSGNGGNLTLEGPEPVAGISGGALEFSGRAFAFAESSEVLSISGSLSMSAWVKPAGTADQAGIMGKYIGEPGMEGYRKAQRSYSLKISHGMPIGYVSEEGDYTSTKRLESRKFADLGKWTHLAMVYEAGEEMRIYMDGKLVTMDSEGVPNFLHRNDSPLLIGTDYRNGDSRNFFTGTIDEVRVYSRPLNIREIRMLSGGRQ